MAVVFKVVGPVLGKSERGQLAFGKVGLRVGSNEACELDSMY